MIDRNQLTGILVIMTMLLAWQYFIGNQELTPEQKAAFKADSLKRVEANKPKTQVNNVPAVLDTIKKSEQLFTLENADIKIELSSIGGTIKKVSLKKHRSYEAFEQKKSENLVIFDDKDKIELVAGSQKYNSQGFAGKQTGNTVVFSSAINGKAVTQTYTLPNEGYSLDYKLTSPENIQVNWIEQITPTEKDLVDNRTKSTINFLDSEDEFDRVSEIPSGTEEEKPELPLKWISLKQKYFVNGLIANGFNFKKGDFHAEAFPEDEKILKTLTAKFEIPAEANGKSMTYYFGPNKLNELQKVGNEFDKNVYLGYEVFKPINKYIFVPLFNFLEKLFSNYGLLIVLLVLIIKLALTPLTYKSYVSMAKMKLLQPELAAIKEKVGDDAMKQQQEQMKLYQQVGVSPMSGCIPVLATMPVLMSVFFLFPNLFELRQQPFLWANDLSTFDSIIKLPFKIPFYGAHVSIFTLIMTVSSLAYGYYNNQITPQQTGQPFDMRIMAYVTPVIFMFVMNTFPAGLSFYYFISNVITIAQQLIIRKFVDNDKLKAVLEENRKKIAAQGGPKKSKFSAYLEKSMKAAEEAKKQQEIAAKAKSKKK